MPNFSFDLIMNNLQNFIESDRMKKILIISVFIFASLANSFSQDINKKIQNNASNEEMLIGLCNRQGLQSGVFAKWFNEEYGYYNYLMERTTLDSIKSIIDSFQITIVMGTWCSDSKEQVPRLYSMLDYMKYKDKNLTLYCVDLNKKTMANETDHLQILKVPTIIFYYKGKEIGRIIETPVKSLEKDMMRIIRSVTLNNGGNGK
jgi:hypothetical protein